MIILIIVIAIIAYIGFMLDRIDRRNEENRRAIIAVAERYVTDTYEHEMVYADFGRNVFTLKTGVYSVSFSKENNLDFVFEVFLVRSIETGEFNVWKDNFFEVLIRNGLLERHAVAIYSMWNEDARIAVNINEQFLREISNYLDEFSTIDDIANDRLNNNFSIVVTIPYVFGFEEKELEAVRVYKLIRILQENEYLPSILAISRVREENLAATRAFWDGSINTDVALEEVKAEVDRLWYREWD